MWERPPPLHKSFSFEFGTNRQQEILSRCLTQNHIDLCLFWFQFPNSQPNPPTRALLVKDCFQTVSRCQPWAKKKKRKRFYENITLKYASIPLVEIMHCVGIEWGGEVRRWKMTLHHELSVSSGWNRNIWYNSAPKNTNPAKETAFKTNATSFVGFCHNLLEVLLSFRATGLAVISMCRRYLLHAWC